MSMRIWNLVITMLEQGEKSGLQSWVGGALRRAAENGHQGVVKLQAERGAVMNDHVDDDTPLMHAATYRHEYVVDFLLQKEADVHYADRTGQAVLQVAATKTHENAV
ncbi:hypothetical protein BDV40DRAFT_294361 [Aspergillus tamarii]|uniref:Ankyrin repeat-containing domain protein n=1 Tax=Aspergillus tamarii TaxID=41984 RepID=A0A5N6VBK7_ASPTM|nr:hypothetical protein BDV40DRAFT_294361 [Aspergillus tamarii]